MLRPVWRATANKGRYREAIEGSPWADIPEARSSNSWQPLRSIDFQPESARGVGRRRQDMILRQDEAERSHFGQNSPDASFARSDHLAGRIDIPLEPRRR